MEEPEAGPAVRLRKEQARLIGQVAELRSLEGEQILPWQPNQAEVSFPLRACEPSRVDLMAQPRPRVVTRSAGKLLLSQNRPSREQLASPDGVTGAQRAAWLVRCAVHQHPRQRNVRGKRAVEIAKTIGWEIQGRQKIFELLHLFGRQRVVPAQKVSEGL